MMKTLLILISSILLFFSPLFSQEEKENTPAKTTATQGTGTFYVSAAQGLNIRSAPSRSGVVIVKMPFQSQVEVLEYSKEEDEYEGNRAKWAKLKFKSQKNKSYKGWAFSHYLSKSRSEK